MLEPLGRMVVPPTVLLVDTFSAFFRAHYALPPMATRAGFPTSALYGVSVLMMKLLRENRGAALAFAMDGPEATFRHQAVADYKAGRTPTPMPLRVQLQRLPALLDALAVPVLRVPGFEADDILATLAGRTRHLRYPTLVVSGDRDLLQLAHGSVRVHFIGRRGQDAIVYDEETVIRRFGIPPQRLPAYSALVGDVADNIPSVPGIGASRARKLLQAAPTCADLLAALDRVQPPRLRAILADHSQQLLRSEMLARLRHDVPLPADTPGWEVPSQASFQALAHQFEDLEFQSLAKRLEALSASAPAACSSP